MLTIGDRNRAGNLEIVDTNYVPGSAGQAMRVTVRALFTAADVIGGKLPVQNMRRLARGAVPGKIKRSPVVNSFRYQGCDYLTFCVDKRA